MFHGIVSIQVIASNLSHVEEFVNAFKEMKRNVICSDLTDFFAVDAVGDVDGNNHI